MSWVDLLLIYLAILGGSMIGGASIGAAMGLAGIVGVTMVSGTNLWPTFGDIVWNTTTNFTLVSIPLFILMGELILQGGVAGRFYNGVTPIFRRVPGGLAQTNIFGCAVFSAIAGSSVATALTVGTVAVGEMRKRGYDDRLTLGTLTAGGCLGILIPPSIPLIVYGSITQASVIDLFMAGVVPGIMLALIFATYVAVRVIADPGLAPSRETLATTDGEHRLRDALPVLGLVASVIGGMYHGIVTPTEASAFGCLLALILCLVQGTLDRARLQRAMVNTLITSAVVLFITLNAQILNFAIVSSGVGRGLAAWLVDLQISPFLFFCVLLVVYLVVGMFIDGLSIVLLTVPLLAPVLPSLGYDVVWFGIILVIFIELGALTPPMGLNLFAVQSIVPDRKLSDVAAASLPYCGLIIAFAFVMYFLPELALWLPEKMK
jgi:tripartite ATP-independent transporter DctM subunit